VFSNHRPMQFRTLEHIDTGQLAAAFTEAFSDYIVPMQIDRAQLDRKIVQDRIDLSLSAGAFNGERLVAFILHGIDTENGEKTAYNGGTGVIPSMRGQQLTTGLYHFILPRLKAAGVTNVLLEVITGNTRALKVYESIGFRTLRTLSCYKGNVPAFTGDSAHLRPLETPDWPAFTAFWETQPSWQYNRQAVTVLQKQLALWGAFTGNTLCGYIIFDPGTNRIVQVAVDKAHRRQGLGMQLVTFSAGNTGRTIAAINVDAGCTAAARLLQKAGLQPYIQQYEMKLNLTE